MRPLIIVVGPTASGKTRLAVELAKLINGEIISADSRQVYTGMDLGTGKDIDLYKKNNVNYHLIDIKRAGDKYNLDEFKKDFANIYLKRNYSIPYILCGGTLLYINSLISDTSLTSIPINNEIRSLYENKTIDECLNDLSKYPRAHWSHVDTKSKKRIIRGIEIAEFLNDNPRPKFERIIDKFIIIGLKDNLTSRRNKIYDRLLFRINQGLIDEVKLLLNSGLSHEDLIYYGLEYKFASYYLKGDLDFQTFLNQLFIEICRYAKRQTTFLRKMEKEGAIINWINSDLKINEQVDLANKIIAEKLI